MQSLSIAYALFDARYPRLAAWARQTSTILGIVGIVGIVVGVVLGEMSWSLAIPAVASAVTALVLPGHPEAEASVRRAAEVAVQLADKESRGAAIAALPADLIELGRTLGVDPVALALARAGLGTR